MTQVWPGHGGLDPRSGSRAPSTTSARPARSPTRGPVRAVGVRAVAVVVLLLATCSLTGTVAGAQQPPPTPVPAAPTTVPLRFPAAFVVVDADTGAVITGLNDRQPRRPASTTKILTALVVRSRLDRETPVKISAGAAATPARKLTLEVGETWRAGDLLQAMLICSCNDAAVALAEAAGGSLDGFAQRAREVADELGLRDHPRLVDPSGLDDEFSVKGGNLISARDLAIAARAFLADDLLAGIAVAPNHRFVGGDGEIHEVVNHNRLLGHYPGAIGVKTGFTRRSGSSLVAAARRNGRTIIAVLLDSPDVYLQAGQLLDIGFATARQDLRRLPLLTAAEERARAARAAPAPSRPTTSPATSERASPERTSPEGASEEASRAGAPYAARATGSASGGSSPALWIGALVLLVLLVALRRRSVVRHRRRRAAARPLRSSR